MERVEPEFNLDTGNDLVDFVKVYDCFLPRIYKYIRYRIGNPDEAEDLTSRVFELALTKISSYKPERAPIANWLFTIAHNTLTDYFRIRSRHNFVSLEVIGEMACTGQEQLERVIEKEKKERLLQAMSCLSDQERNIIGLKFASGFRNQEISEITGLTKTNIAVIIYRAIQKLRLKMSEEE